MSIAQIGGAASPQVLYGKNTTGAAVSPGAYLQYDLADGSSSADGYNFVAPDLDVTKPETYAARGGVVWTAEGPLAASRTFADDAAIAVVAEGYVPLCSVDGSSVNIAAGDLLVRQDASTALVKLVGGDVGDGLASVNSTASSEAGNSSTSQVFHDQTVSIPANSLAVGDIVEVFGQGYIADNNGTDTATMSVQFGGTNIGLSSAVDVSDGDVWSFSAKVYVTAIGASGTMLAAGVGAGPDALGVALGWPINASLSSIDTTAAVVVRTGVQFSASSPDNGSVQRLLGYRVIRQSSGAVAVALEAATTATNIAAYVLKK